MQEFQHSIQIDAPVDVAWRLLSHVGQWPQWLPTVSEVRPLGPSVVEPGARFIVRQPKLASATWLVTEVSPPHSFVWESYSPGVRMRASHVLTAPSPSTCALELRFAFSGWLEKPLSLLFARLTQSYLAQECAALKTAAEQAVAAGSDDSFKSKPLRGSA